MKQTTFLQPLKSANGNTVYVEYSQSKKKDSKGAPLINARIAQEGWAHGQTFWEFAEKKYNSPLGHSVKIEAQVDNTQGWITDYITLTDFQPKFEK